MEPPLVNISTPVTRKVLRYRRMCDVCGKFSFDNFDEALRHYKEFRRHNTQIRHHCNGKRGGLSYPIVDMLSKTSDVGGDGDAVELSPIPPRTPPLLLPSPHNPRMFFGTTSERRWCSTTLKIHAVTSRVASRSPPLSYLWRVVVIGPEAASAPPISLQPDMLWSSLVR